MRDHVFYASCFQSLRIVHTSPFVNVLVAPKRREHFESIGHPLSRSIYLGKADSAMPGDSSFTTARALLRISDRPGPCADY
jgi:hypothetical protein